MLYKESQKMADLIADQPGVLLVMSRFGMPLGVGDQTVSEYGDGSHVKDIPDIQEGKRCIFVS